MERDRIVTLHLLPRSVMRIRRTGGQAASGRRGVVSQWPNNLCWGEGVQTCINLMQVQLLCRLGLDLGSSAWLLLCDTCVVMTVNIIVCVI
jgi:hypothetical protein